MRREVDGAPAQRGTSGGWPGCTSGGERPLPATDGTADDRRTRADSPAAGRGPSAGATARCPGRWARSSSGASSRSIPPASCRPARCGGPRSRRRPGSRSARSCCRPIVAPRAMTALWLALLGVLLLATINAVDPLHGVDRHPRPPARSARVAHVPRAVPRRARVRAPIAALRARPRRGTLAAIVLGGVERRRARSGIHRSGSSSPTSAPAVRSASPRTSAPRACSSGPLAGRDRARSHRDARSRGAFGARRRSRARSLALLASQTRAAWVGAVVVAAVLATRAAATRRVVRRHRC